MRSLQNTWKASGEWASSLRAGEAEAPESLYTLIHWLSAASFNSTLTSFTALGLALVCASTGWLQGAHALQAPAEVETPTCVCVCVCVCIFCIPLVSNGRRSRRKRRCFSLSAHRQPGQPRHQEFWALWVVYEQALWEGTLCALPSLCRVLQVPSSRALPAHRWRLSHHIDNANPALSCP